MSALLSGILLCKGLLGGVMSQIKYVGSVIWYFTGTQCHKGLLGGVMSQLKYVGSVIWYFTV